MERSPRLQEMATRLAGEMADQRQAQCFAMSRISLLDLIVVSISLTRRDEFEE